MEGLITIFLFVGVIAITAVVFVLWIFVTIIKAIFRALLGVTKPIRTGPAPVVRPAVRNKTCTHDHCLAVNPADARFCRRCGREFPEIRRVNVRRAAMW